MVGSATAWVWRTAGWCCYSTSSGPGRTGRQSRRRPGCWPRAATQQRPGPYRLQAAIVACHADAERWEDTDWEQIVLLYDMSLALAPSPVTRPHRAIALRYAAGPRAAMTELDALAGALDRYHLYHATRAELLRELGHPEQARAADRLALELPPTPPNKPSFSSASPGPSPAVDPAMRRAEVASSVVLRSFLGVWPPRPANRSGITSTPSRDVLVRLSYRAGRRSSSW